MHLGFFEDSANDSFAQIERATCPGIVLRFESFQFFIFLHGQRQMPAVHTDVVMDLLQAVQVGVTLAPILSKRLQQHLLRVIMLRKNMAHGMNNRHGSQPFQIMIEINPTPYPDSRIGSAFVLIDARREPSLPQDDSLWA